MKKSLFKKPAWSSTATSTAPTAAAEEDNDDFFRRSDETYTRVVAEKARRKAERKERDRLEKEAAEAEESSRVKRRKTSESGDGVDVGESQQVENRRSMSLAQEPEIGRGEGSPLEASRPIPLHAFRSDSRELHSPATVHSTLEEPRSGIIVDLEDFDGREVVAVAAPEQVPVEDEAEDEEDDDEPEFKELRRKAREKNRVPRPASPDPVLKIFVTSPIENTKPLIVQRRLSQALREVRKAYCEKQQLTPEFAKRTFFVHRGIRVFDNSTCKNLGIHVEPDGSLSDRVGGISTMEGHRVDIELLTPEIFEEQQRQRMRHFSQEIDENDERVQEQGPEQDAEPNLRLNLKGKGFEEFKITVKSSTTLATVVAMLRRERGIGEEKKVELVFDGDNLPLDTTVADNDLEDQDGIHVKVE